MIRSYWRPPSLAKQVGLHGDDYFFQSVIGDIAVGHGQRIGRDVDGIDLRVGEGMGHDDGQAG